MSTIHQVLLLIIIADIGYTLFSLMTIPILGRAWRQRTIAGGFVIALAFTTYWLVVYLNILLIGHYRRAWIPVHTSQLLALGLAVEAWWQLIWFWRWKRRVNERID